MRNQTVSVSATWYLCHFDQYTVGSFDSDWTQQTIAQCGTQKVHSTVINTTDFILFLIKKMVTQWKPHVFLLWLLHKPESFGDS